MNLEEQVEELLRKGLHYRASTELRDEMLASVLSCHDEAVQHGTPGFARSLSRWAVAAILLLGAYMVSIALMPSSDVTDSDRVPGTLASQNSTQENGGAPQLQRDSEIEQADRLFAERDVAGLARLLRQCQDGTKHHIASYLGQIGDSSVLSALLPLAEGWQGPQTENPFLSAITSIRAREAETRVTPEVTAPDRESSEPRTEPKAEQTSAEPIQAEGLGRIYGSVVDAATGEPITQFRVRMRPNMTYPRGGGVTMEWTISGRTFNSIEGYFDTRKLRLMVGGHYQVTVTAEGYEPLSLDSVASQSVSAALNRTEFRLDAARVLQGRVLDASGEPISGASITFLSEPRARGQERRPRAVTDQVGTFTIIGLGNQPEGVLVAATGFTPRLFLLKDLIDASDQPVDIVLEGMATCGGYVYDENGQGILGAKVIASIDSTMFIGVLDQVYSSGSRALTDEEGYYYFSDLPSGKVQITALSPTHLNLGTIGRHLVNLLPGEHLELSFGDEGGYVISGRVLAGGAPIERARVTLHSELTTTQDGYYEARMTDGEGAFRFIHVPGGPCMIHVHWEASRVRGETDWPRDTTFDWRHALEVGKELDLEIDVVNDSIAGRGGGVIRGVIPERFRSNEGLSFWVSKLVSPVGEDTDPKWQSSQVPAIRIETDGRFTFSDVPEGRYKLGLYDAERMLTFSEVIEMGQEGLVEGVRFMAGYGQLLVRVTDAGTGEPVPGGLFSLSRDGKIGFWNNAYSPTRTYGRMTVNASGERLYDDLLAGWYLVRAQAYGYFSGEVESANVVHGQDSVVTVPLKPCALVRFELSEDLKRVVGSDPAFVRCRVSDVKIGAPVTQGRLGRVDEEHQVTLSPSDPAFKLYSALHLPEGTYAIDYTLRKRVEAKQGLPETLLQRTKSVECRIGEISTIFIEGP